MKTHSHESLSNRLLFNVLSPLIFKSCIDLDDTW